MTLPPISNDALVEKVLGFFEVINTKLDNMRTEVRGQERRLEDLETHEAVSVEWHHQHEVGPSHPDLHQQNHNFEMKIGAMETEIATLRADSASRKADDDYKRGVKDGMAKSLSIADKVWVMIMAAIPTSILIYTQLIR